MRRTLFWILISLLTFVLGVATAFSWLYCSNLAKAKVETDLVALQESVASDETPIFAFCELVNNPDKYDGKVVRISAKLSLNHHSTLFLDKNCSEQGKAIAVIFNSVEQLSETIDRIVQQTKPEQKSYCIPEIITVGKFSRIKEVNETNSWIKDFPFQFEIQKVEKVSRY